MHNEKSTVNFPTRICNGSSSAVNNIDLSRNFTINPLINAQQLKLQNIIAPIQEFTSCYVGNISSFTMDVFQSKWSTESWEDIFEGSDTNVIFNNFLNIT